MNAHVQRRLMALAALAVAGGAIAWMSMSSLGEDLVYYWSPTELREKGELGREATVRIMGLVEAGSVDWRPDEQMLRFRVTDGQTSVAIEGRGAPPQMFREGIGVVVEGELGADDVFRSHDVLVKHGNEYRPPEDGEHPGDVYKSLAEGS